MSVILSLSQNISIYLTGSLNAWRRHIRVNLPKPGAFNSTTKKLNSTKPSNTGICMQNNPLPDEQWFSQSIGFSFSDRVSPLTVLECKRRVEKYLYAGQVLTAAGYTNDNYILTKCGQLHFFLFTPVQKITNIWMVIFKHFPGFMDYCFLKTYLCCSMLQISEREKWHTVEWKSLT